MSSASVDVEMADAIDIDDNRTDIRQAFHHTAFTALELFQTIFKALNPITMVHLAKVSRKTHDAFQSFVKIGFDPNLHFARFFPSASITFRNMLRLTEALVSGSDVLQLVNGESYPTADLDVYVGLDHGLTLCKFIRSTGYSYVPRQGQSRRFSKAWASVITHQANWVRHHPAVEGTIVAGNPYHQHILAIFDFEHSYQGRKRIVQVIVTDTCPLASILGSFHSSTIFFFLPVDHAMTFSSSQPLSSM